MTPATALQIPTPSPRAAAKPLVAARPAAATPEQRQQLLREAADLHRQAKELAEQGDLDQAGRRILQALDRERRAGGLGPQVLQLIKPRS